MKVVLASNNAGKIREFNALFQPLDLELISQATLGVDEIEETGLSFIENALIKARHAARMTGLPAMADDSGLVVSALKGAPGIYSARFAGKNANAEENIDKLLLALNAVPQEKRCAYFYAAIVFLSHDEDPTPLIATGSLTGKILTKRIGTEGFGYDPVFYIPELKKTAAELPLALKNQISHRGKALQQLIKQLLEKL